jgi:hypothetical protein
MDHPIDADRGQPFSRPACDRTRVLLEINNAIVSHLDLAEVLKAVSACVHKEVKHDFAALALYDAEANQLRLHALDFPHDRDFLKKGQLILPVGTPAALAFSSWCSTLPESEYQACSPAHCSAGATTAPDGRRMSINVEILKSIERHALRRK